MSTVDPAAGAQRGGGMSLEEEFDDAYLINDSPLFRRWQTSVEFHEQLRDDRRGQLWEPAGQVTTVPADEPRASSVLVGEDAPAVDFLLEDPAGAVEGALHVGRGHRRLDDRDGGGRPASGQLRPCCLPVSGLRSATSLIMIKRGTTTGGQTPRIEYRSRGTLTSRRRRSGRLRRCGARRCAGWWR